MSLISVDFVSLENQIKRLGEYLQSIENMISDTEGVYRRIAGMELFGAEDELLHACDILREAAKSLEKDIYRLKRITELYDECECRIVSALSKLPLNIPYQPVISGVIDIDEADLMRLRLLKSEAYYGHTIINDSWLDDIIMGTED